MADDRHLCTHCGFNECMYHEYLTIDEDNHMIDICKLGLYNVPEKDIRNYGLQGHIYHDCPCYVKPNTKNRLTMLGMRKNSMMLLERIKSRPYTFIEKYLGMNLNWFQKFVLKHLLKDIQNGDKNDG